MNRAYPHFDRRITHNLNGYWDFAFSSEMRLENVETFSVDFNDRIPVPCAFDALPAYAGKRGVGIYRQQLHITPDRTAILHVGAAGLRCAVFVDGARRADQIGGYTPFDVIIPAASQATREIVIATDNRFDYELNPLHEPYFDFYQYGGLIRPIWLDELPAHSIRRARVHVEDWRAGQIRVLVEFHGEPASLSCSIDGQLVSITKPETVAPDVLSLSAIVPNPAPWHPDTPTLHVLRLDTGTDAITVRFGLRKIAAKDGRIYLNEDPIKLLGYCRHEAHPQFGPALPPALMTADIQLLKAQGCNFVRGAHYQQDPRFLDLCDEQGVLVFSESLSWQAGQRQLTDPKFIEAQVDQTRTMILEDFNHPAIILWGFLNEGASHEESARVCYQRLIECIRELDDTRLVTYASNRAFNDLYLEAVDVVSFNMYPGWYSEDRHNECPLDEVIPALRERVKGLADRGLSDKPLLISEIGAGAIYGWRDPMNGIWTEAYQSELLNRACREVIENSGIAGMAIWQFCDMRTYQGSDALARPRAFNNKGTVDEYRRPKAAYHAVRAAFSRTNEISKEQIEHKEKKG